MDETREIVPAPGHYPLAPSAPGRAAPGRHYLSLAEALALGEVLARSKYFKDAQSAAQCVVKILRGSELGIPAIAAMESIYVIEGKTSLSATLIASLIATSGRYSYRVAELDLQHAVVTFFDRGEALGSSSFDTADAARAGLLNNHNWKHYPKSMLFSRALTAGARMYCPAVFNGAIYTPEELRPETEVTEGGEIVDVAALAPAEPAATGDEPIDDDELRALNGALARLRVTGAERGLLVEAASANRVRHVADLTSGEAARLWAAIETRRAARPFPGGNGAAVAPEGTAAELI